LASDKPTATLDARFWILVTVIVVTIAVGGILVS
jgi:hypothetical protein